MKAGARPTRHPPRRTRRNDGPSGGDVRPARRLVEPHQTTGFCKLIIDRATHSILGCQIVCERAVDIVQTAAIAIATGLRVDDLARVPLSFPTYTGLLGRAAAISARALGRDSGETRFAEWM